MTENKKSRELKAIVKGEQIFTSQITRVKALSDAKSEDRDIRKMKMIESLFLKKQKEDEHKRMLREKREKRKLQPATETPAKPDKEQQKETSPPPTKAMKEPVSKL